jgi:hypothetical protein
VIVYVIGYTYEPLLYVNEFDNALPTMKDCSPDVADTLMTGFWTSKLSTFDPTRPAAFDA